MVTYAIATVVSSHESMLARSLCSQSCLQDDWKRDGRASAPPEHSGPAWLGPARADLAGCRHRLGEPGQAAGMGTGVGLARVVLSCSGLTRVRLVPQAVELRPRQRVVAGSIDPDWVRRTQAKSNGAQNSLANTVGHSFQALNPRSRSRGRSGTGPASAARGPVMPPITSVAAWRHASSLDSRARVPPARSMLLSLQCRILGTPSHGWRRLA